MGTGTNWYCPRCHAENDYRGLCDSCDSQEDTRESLPDDVKEALYACAQLIGYVSVCDGMKEYRQSGNFPQLLKDADDKTQSLAEKYQL